METNPIPAPPGDAEHIKYWMAKTFPVGTPVVFRHGAHSKGSWIIPDGVRGVVISHGGAHAGTFKPPHEIEVRIYPPLPGDPRFAEPERLGWDWNDPRISDVWVSWWSAANGDIWPLVDTWASAQQPYTGRKLKGSLKPNVTPSVPPPNVAVSMGSMSAWERWIATTFAPGTPVKLIRGLSWVGRANAAQGVPRLMHPEHPVQKLSLGVGTRLEVVGRAVKTPGHAGSWWIPAVVTDARDPSGLRLPHDGTRVDVEWQYLEPLVDNWATAQPQYTGRKLKPTRPNRRTSRRMVPNIPLRQLAVPPPKLGNNFHLARWLLRTFAPGTPVKLVGEFSPMYWADAIPSGARGESTGPWLSAPNSWSVNVKFTDVRDANGLPLSHIIGRSADIPWQHLEPLVDNWATAQPQYMGRKLKGSVQPNSRRRTTRSKELDKLVALARAQGWAIESTARGHLRRYPPDPSQDFTVTSSNRSDPRAIKNIRAQLRRAGLKANRRTSRGVRANISLRRQRTSRGRRRRVSRNTDLGPHRCRVWCYDYRRGWHCEDCGTIADRRTARWLDVRSRGGDRVGR